MTEPGFTPLIRDITDTARWNEYLRSPGPETNETGGRPPVSLRAVIQKAMTSI